MERLATRRHSPHGPTTEQVRELCLLAADTGRQLGLLVDRQGKVSRVIVGTPSGVFIPELGRSRAGEGRLRGLTLVRVMVCGAAQGGELVTSEDRTDLLFLRLDGVLVLACDEHGQPGRAQLAQLAPPTANVADVEDVQEPHGAEPLAADEAPAAPSAAAPSRARIRVDAPVPATELATRSEDIPAAARAIEDELARTASRLSTRPDLEAAVAVHVSNLPRAVADASVAELAALAETAGLHIADAIIQRTPRMNPRTVLGKGRLEDLELACLAHNAELIVFDRELTPAQMRNLADASERRVIDRTQLILDIFAQHATTKAGKLQVELAQLSYRLPRLAGQNRALSRLAGGIGGRGPGEKQLEIDRRRIRDRISRMKQDLKTLRKQRAQRRSRREKSGVPVISLVGYTNAGKSTLLNTLTGAEVLAENKLFATLDPTTRRIRFPQEREVILTDTVGFIRSLPEELKEAFGATLEELEEADLLVHVVDASHPEADSHIHAVTSILEEMDLSRIPTLLVLNKWERTDPETRDRFLREYPDAVTTSATDKPTLAPLVERILSQVDEA